MLRALLAKDLLRAWRNPVPWLINLALPLCITGLIGLVFGGKPDTGLGRIRFAVVDEDNSALTGMLRGALNQREGGKYLEPVFVNRATALRQITDNALSAAVIIPTNFTRAYLNGDSGVKLELIKNPAQSIHPTVLEELMEVLVTALNGVARNFSSEFPAVRGLLEGEFDYHKVAGMLEHAGDKFKAVGKYLNPPLVVYDKALEQTPAEKTNGPATSAVFAYLLLGMSSMFLLFLAGNAVSDLLRELRFRTFERYQTMRQHLLPFVLGKLVFAVVLLLFASAVMLGGGGLIFRIQWQHPLSLIALTLGYACFGTALMAMFVGLMPDERRANALSNVIGMLLAMAGGCMFPREQLPRFLGQHVAPLLPSAWFVDAGRALQFGDQVSIGLTLLKLVIVALVCLAGAVLIFQRRFQTGATK